MIAKKNIKIQNVFSVPGLFGENVSAPLYPQPATPFERARRIADKYNKRRDAYQEFISKPVDLTAFKNDRETGAQYIGQNIYIKPSYVVSMPEYCYFDRNTGEMVGNPRILTADFVENQKNLLDNQTKGKLSKKAVSGLRNAINWLCLAATKKWVYDKKKDRTFSFKVNFVTLTLPDTAKPISSAELQKKLLNPFLTYMRQYHGLKNYVWRLEFQANGKLHVHLTSDTFLHLVAIRDTWNQLLDNHGYLDMFFKNNGHKDPNSTDVHATKKIKNLAAYLAKYMSKKNSLYKISKKKGGKALGSASYKAWYFQRLNFWNSSFNPRPITGRIWYCSKGLSEANNCQVHVPSNDCAKDLNCFMRSDIEYKQIMSVPKTVLESILKPSKKIGEVYFLKARDWYDKITGPVRKAFDETRRAVASLTVTTVFELN